MSKEKPDYQDIELTLKLYDLRRETVMRESRNALNMKFWPKSYEEFVAVTKPDHPMNAAFRQVSGYWEMVYSFAAHGIVNADFLVENNGEGLFFFAKVHPHLQRFRKEVSPTSFKNTEWISTQCAAGRQRFELIQGRVRKMLESR